MSKIAAEFERLRTVFAWLGVPFTPSTPATDQEVAKVRTETGIEPCSELIELWQISNGSNGAMWLECSAIMMSCWRRGR